MKKNILNIWVFTLVSVLVLTSCDDYLELQPKDALIQEEFWQNEDHVASAVAGCYSSLTETNFTDRLFKWGELRAEMLVSNSASNDDQRMLRNNIIPSNGLLNWSSLYKTINYCNLVLEFTDQAQELDLSFTDEEAATFKAEATAIRSFVYFILVKNFKEVPLVLAATSNTQVEFNPVKSTEEEILNQIIGDLESVIENLRPGYESNDYDKGRITQGGALALLADIYLWNEQYDECISACNRIEEIERPVKYALEEKLEWFNNIFFVGNAVKESIFEIQFRNKDATTIRNSFSIDGSTPDYAIYNEIERLYRNEEGEVDVRGELGTYNGPVVWKYVGVDNTGLIRGANEYRNNFIVYRYADVMLMKAEALILSSTQQDFTAAHKLINDVHERAASGSVEQNLSESFLLNALLLERQKEFAYEGKRWHDLLRFAKRNGFERQDLILALVDIKAGDDDFQQVLSYYSDEESYYLPISNDELNRNPNLVQNPYYDN